MPASTWLGTGCLAACITISMPLAICSPAQAHQPHILTGRTTCQSLCSCNGGVHMTEAHDMHAKLCRTLGASSRIQSCVAQKAIQLHKHLA